MKVLLLLALISFISAHIHLHRDGDHHHIECGTQEVYEYRLNNSIKGKNCFVTNCDDPTVRDKTNTDTVTINIAVIVINEAINQNQLQVAIDNLQDAYKSANIKFQVTNTTFAEDDDLKPCIPPYRDDDIEWYLAIENLKEKYAFEPANNLNIFVSCQEPSDTGAVLLGIATFPWDQPIALQSLGGLWMNGLAMDPLHATLPHEVGHCLGLWHTFHGVAEVNPCTSCYEYVHAPLDKLADENGDFCSDTSSTTRNYGCFDPTGSDCKRVSWGKTNWDNIMGYSRQSSSGKQVQCRTKFTTQQTSRMHCYLKGIMNGWIAK